jgi:hypothetical protein
VVLGVEVKSSAAQQVFRFRQVFVLINTTNIDLVIFLFILANFDEVTVEKLPSSIYQGVYYGWAKLLAKDDNQIYKMVTSVGTNPFYNGEKKTMVR